LNKELGASMPIARLFILLLGTSLLATCYNPQIVEGGLTCTANAECPSGFKCMGTTCWKVGSIPPIGGMGGGTAGAGGTGGGTGGSGGGCMSGPAYGPFPGCTAPAGGQTCDAVCQSGCGCKERCKLEGGNPVCRAEGPDFLPQYDACSPTDDRCRPGAICLQESQDHAGCGAHCYRHCRVDADCPNAKCTIEVQFGNSTTTNKVCSPPMDTCNPFGQARCGMQEKRPYPTFGCYVMSSSYPDIAICDCAGTTQVGQACTYEHECEPGAECVLLGTARLCRRVCKVGAVGGAVAGGCPAVNPICTPFPGGTVYGYCH
jgi:hypothetical protein